MKKGFTKQDFYDKLTPNGDCLEWTLGKHRQGYGLTKYKDKMVTTHRLAMMIEGNDIDGWHVLHSCDNPPCCNPAHLRLGTHKENMEDRSDRGNRRNYSKTLTVEQILEIREKHANGIRGIDMSKEYDVSKATISCIVNRVTWKNI